MNLGARNRTGKRRLGDYGKAPGGINQAEWSDGFAAELIDRFGTLPLGVENLLEIIAIKRSCRDAGIEKLEAGPKGRGRLAAREPVREPSRACRADSDVTPAP